MAQSAKPSRLAPADIARHYHQRPYATLILEGGYEEAGDQGRFRVSAGDVLLHPAFSAHQDHVDSVRTTVLDLPLPFDGREWPALAHLKDPDQVIRSASRDAREAQELLLDDLTPLVAVERDEADQLAGILTADPSTAIGTWAADQGYCRETLSRRFTLLYGIDSARFRIEARTRLAWRQIVSTDEPLAQIASASGFADQAHMTRSIGRLTGRPPKAWRRIVTSVQESNDSTR
jgi:AraC-like DNA-binding protein